MAVATSYSWGSGQESQRLDHPRVICANLWIAIANFSSHLQLSAINTKTIACCVRTLRVSFPADVLREIEGSFAEMGRLAGAELYEMQLADRLNEPTLTQWDAWGNRIDKIELTPLWRVAERIAAEHGVVATAYEQKHGSLSRVHQCALGLSLHTFDRHLQLSTRDD